MYPIVRAVWQMWKHRTDPPLSPGQSHVSHHWCLPWDLDIFMELNNGRTLTLYDLGRIPAGARLGINRALRENGWGMTMAGVHVRYRRRIRAFERIEMRTRLVTWDERFLYIEQSMWKTNGECANHALYRTATTGPSGIVPSRDFVSAMGHDPEAPTPPDWIARWIEADAARPWPPTPDSPSRLPAGPS